MKKPTQAIIETHVSLPMKKNNSDEITGTSCSFDTSTSNNNETTETKVPQKLVSEIIYPFDRYEVTVLLSSDGKFCGISSIKESRDFLSNEQFLGKFKSINTDDFYNNEDE